MRREKTMPMAAKSSPVTGITRIAHSDDGKGASPKSIKTMKKQPP